MGNRKRKAAAGGGGDQKLNNKKGGKKLKCCVYKATSQEHEKNHLTSLDLNYKGRFVDDILVKASSSAK